MACGWGSSSAGADCGLGSGAGALWGRAMLRSDAAAVLSHDRDGTSRDGGQIVEKAGLTTGKTFGQVSNATSSQPMIDPGPGGPASVSLDGDSGSIWVEQDTRLAVGLHRAGTETSGQMVKIDPVLSSLKVRF
jgi:hypothetical protein